MDRQRLKRELARAYGRGDLSDEDYEHLRKKAIARMTNDQVKLALQAVGCGVAVVTAVTSAIAGSLGGDSPTVPADGVEGANQEPDASQGNAQNTNDYGIDYRRPDSRSGDTEQDEVEETLEEQDDPEQMQEDCDEDDDVDDYDVL